LGGWTGGAVGAEALLAGGEVGGVEAFGALVAVEAGFEGGVFVVAGLVVFLEVEELAEEGLGAGQEAAVVVPEAGQRRGGVLEEVGGGEGVGGGVPRAEFRVPGGEGRGEDLVFEVGDLVELPGQVGELGDQDLLHGGGGAELVDQLPLGLAVGGVGEERGGWGGRAEVMRAGVLGGAVFALRGAGAGGVLGVGAVAVRSRGVHGGLSMVRCRRRRARGAGRDGVVGREGDAGHSNPLCWNPLPFIITKT
jgi:hypothetical protein